MAANKTIFECNQCSWQSPKWLGRCPECGAWNSFEEVRKSAPSDAKSSVSFGRGKGQSLFVPLDALEETNVVRVFTGIPELDRVLGGGLVPGSMTLLSGEPGIGKSTLLMQALHALAVRGFHVVYASGEESPEQIRLRAGRMGCVHGNILLSTETEVLTLLDHVKQRKPDFLVVDSIQTMSHPEISSSPGSVSQVRECSATLLEYAKGHRVSTVVIGHVTKDGSVAGPKLLEHLVDTVMHLEGDPNTGFRILRSQKNRFGSTGEMGVFSMEHGGLKSVTNASSFFLEARENPREGTAVAVCQEGTRPLLVEIQALVGRSTYSNPRRVVTGLDSSRCQILVAVLEKRAGLMLSTNDLFLGVAAGVRISEPAADLACAAAVMSSLFERPLPRKICFIGEVGLAGEVRPVTQVVARVQECVKLGFERIYLPQRSYSTEKDNLHKLIFHLESDAQLYPIDEVRELRDLVSD